MPAERTVLIAGGGPAADLVRALDRIHGLGDETAHLLALHALDLTAILLAAILPGSSPVDRIEALDGAWDAGSIPILAPAADLERHRSSRIRARSLARELGRDLRHDRRADRRVPAGGVPDPAQERASARGPAATRRPARMVDPSRLRIAGRSSTLPAAELQTPVIARVEYLNLRRARRLTSPRLSSSLPSIAT